MFQKIGALVASLKACADRKDLRSGCKIHADICKQGLLKQSIYLNTALINLYAKCGEFAKAQEIFDGLTVQDAVSWNAIITGYAQYDHYAKAVQCFDCMLREGFSPDLRTFVCISKACATLGLIHKGTEIHAEISKQGFLDKDVFMGTSLVDMYARCGAIAKAQQLFDELQLHCVASWNALIKGYNQHGYCKQALHCFDCMQTEGFCPDARTLVCGLNACGSCLALEKGEEIHVKIDKEGLLDKDSLLGTALVDMYAKCGALAKAQGVFDELHSRDAVSWNALITGYAQYGHCEEAMGYFERMQEEGLSPDLVTYTSILKACGNMAMLDKGIGMHDNIAREGLLEGDISIITALVDMYAKCGALEEARDVFDELQMRNVVCWTVLIAGYVQHGQGEEALKCLGALLEDGFSPNVVTIICLLKACASIGAADKGEQIHAEILKADLLKKDIVVGTALVDMYAKCGALAKAQEVFDNLSNKDAVSWTSLMVGYARHGMGQQALKCFEQVQREGLLSPDAHTFNTLLNACTHAGLLEKGEMYFEIMNAHYGVRPTSQHYTCMVDLFGRAGRFDIIIALLQKMSASNPSRMWTALLGACLKWENVELGRLAFEHAIQIDLTDASAYVSMSNIYIVMSMQEEADKIEALRLRNKAWKKSECYWWAEECSIGNYEHT